MTQKTHTQDTNAAGNRAYRTIKTLWKAGTKRHVELRGATGELVAQFPLIAGIAGAILAPAPTVLGALIAIFTGCTLHIVAKEKSDTPQS